MSNEAVSDGDARRLIVLDDDVASGRLIGRVAGAAGFAPVLTTEAGDFRAAYDQAVPAVIVLDLQLGDTDGIEQLRYLAAQRYLGAVVLVSGFDSRVLATTQALAGGLGLRVAGGFGKPLDVAELREALRRLRTQSGPLDIERVLRALRDDEMIVEYQPIVTRQPRALRKLEALIRWQHPELGRLEPGRFSFPGARLRTGAPRSTHRDHRGERPLGGHARREGRVGEVAGVGGREELQCLVIEVQGARGGQMAAHAATGDRQRLGPHRARERAREWMAEPSPDLVAVAGRERVAEGVEEGKHVRAI